MGKGKRFELRVKNDINMHTRPWVKAHRPDFSGSSAGEVADIMVVWQAERYEPQKPCGHPERFVAYGELKKRSGTEGNRTTVMSGSRNSQSGLGELHELRHETPPWADCYVGIKFDNREMGVFDATALEHHLRQDEEGWGQEASLYSDDAFFDARLTPLDNISMVKPELEWWPSSKAGEPDWMKFLHKIGVEDYDIEAASRP